MLEKLVLAATITFSLNLFIGASHSSATTRTIISSHLQEAPVQTVSVLMSQTFLRNLPYPKSPGS